MNYAGRHGHVLFDRRLYLPEEWISDPPRCADAGVPAGTILRAKPELALEMVAEAASAGVPFRWVGGDSVYGDSPTFVQGIRALDKWYVLDVSSKAYVWTQAPMRRPTGLGPRGGRPVKHAKAVEKPRPVRDWVAELPEKAWKSVCVAEGSQGPRMYEYAELRVWFSEAGFPTNVPERLLVRRSLGQSPEVKFQRTNAPDSVPLAEVAAAGGSRWTVDGGNGFPMRQRGMRIGRIRDAGLGQLASSHLFVHVGLVVFDTPTSTAAGGKRSRRRSPRCGRC